MICLIQYFQVVSMESRPQNRNNWGKIIYGYKELFQWPKSGNTINLCKQVTKGSKVTQSQFINT